MRPRACVLLALLPLLVASAGCVDLMTDRLEESRERARERDDVPEESTEPALDDSDPAPWPVTPTPAATPTPPGPTSATPTPLPTQSGPRVGPWPWPGSHVQYQVTGGEGDGDDRESWTTMVTLTYDGARWSGVCEGARTERRADGAFESRRILEPVGFTPLLGPGGVGKGDTVTVQAISECDLREATLIVQGLYPEDTTRDGQPVRTRAWWADEGPAREAERDEDAWWDADTRLLLRWEMIRFEGDRGATGKLVDTDAPLG